MSDFDNPFADPSRNSPFSDPSVQQARTSSGAGGGGGGGTTGDYNPFDKTQPQQAAPPPAYTASAQQRISSDELERRQRELEAKSRELERREAEQRQREAESSAGAAGSQSPNNWPPLPACCPVGPCFYQDFDQEIPAEYRLVVKLGYYLWLVHSVLLLVNIIGTLTYFIVSPKTDAITSGTVFGVSLLVCIILVPCSYLCWFRPLYKAFKNDSSFNFFFFFLLIAVQICVLIVQCLGINYLGSCGWINGAATLKVKLGAGVFMMVIAALFTLLVIADVLLIIRVHRIYRSSGASFAKARQELSQGVAANETVRSAAAGAATSTFSAMASGSGGGSGGRY
uniref:Secretory carrier-associated membrane protein n=2 Tax=Macrostomum lignano TaxID=282301 RepID=A0A1I8GUV9_9PLAT